MSIRFITPNQHGILDFMVAAVLIAGPFVLGLGDSSPLVVWISVVTGFAVIVLSLLTDYRYGLYRLIPFWGHLMVDGIVGLAFVLIPFMLGFEGLDAIFYWVNGLGVLAVVTLGLTREPAKPSPSTG